MLRTNRCILSVVFCSVIFTAPTFCFADGSPRASRDRIILQQMDCISHNLKNTSVDWQNLCYVPQEGTQDQGSKTAVVNGQLDMMEDARTGDPTPRRYTHLQVDRQSATSMAKEVLNPETSAHPVVVTLPNRVETRKHTFDLGWEVEYYRYAEPDPVGVTNEGPMYGYDAQYAYRPAAPNLFNNPLANVYALQWREAGSRDLEYKGSGIVKGKHDDVDELRGLIGKDYFMGQEFLVTPYIGLGYRYLLDRGNGQLSNTNHWGYDRKSHYYYIPVGGDLVIKMTNKWEIDPNFEYDIFLQGLQKSFMSDGDQFSGANISDVTNHQKRGFGLRGSIKFLRHGSMVDYYVEPYIRYWNIRQSKLSPFIVNDSPTGLYLVEPENNTVEVGTKLGVKF